MGKENSSDRLTKKLDLMGSCHISEEMYAIAYNIESALLYTNAEPGKDYTVMDLFKLAQPFVLEMFKRQDNFEYDYPAKKVAGPAFENQRWR